MQIFLIDSFGKGEKKIKTWKMYDPCQLQKCVTNIYQK